MNEANSAQNIQKPRTFENDLEALKSRTVTISMIVVIAICGISSIAAAGAIEQGFLTSSTTTVTSTTSTTGPTQTQIETQTITRETIVTIVITKTVNGTLELYTTTITTIFTVPGQTTTETDLTSIYHTATTTLTSTTSVVTTTIHCSSTRDRHCPDESESNSTTTISESG